MSTGRTKHMQIPCKFTYFLSFDSLRVNDLTSSPLFFFLALKKLTSLNYPIASAKRHLSNHGQTAMIKETVATLNERVLLYYYFKKILLIVILPQQYLSNV